MTEQLWRRCPYAKWVEHHGYECDCHDFHGLAPVAAGVLLIPDGMEAAIERMAALRWHQDHADKSMKWSDIHEGWRQSYRRDTAALLRAAVGEGDR